VRREQFRITCHTTTFIATSKAAAVWVWEVEAPPLLRPAKRLALVGEKAEKLDKLEKVEKPEKPARVERPGR
jgi:hypothetical protein